MGRVTMKCPCCGAELKFGADGITLSCEYCNHIEYWKEEKTEKVISELDRANALRRANRFSDAIMEYRLIIEQNPDDAEAHWGLVISLYGIDFVKDPRTNRYTPTCHRAVRESILENEDYLKAIECASEVQRAEYIKEATEIDRLQKEILKLSDAEEDYDVFISFKSTDEMGRITRDAQIARIIYDELTKRGIKTFFSDVTLEGKLFSAFEPIIFRALFSCKFFILVGTKEEFINAPWVKNEWSRFEERMETERLSGVACAVFDGAEVRNLPPFARTQGIDLRRYAAGGYEIHVADAVEKKLGRKKRSKEEEEILKQIEAQKQAQRELEERLKGLQQGGAESTGGGASATVKSLLMRAKQELEVKSFDNAKDYYGRVLDADPQNADAWWGLFLVDRNAVDDKRAENTVESADDFEQVRRNRNYISAKRYATGKTVEQIEQFEKDLKSEETLLPRAEKFLQKKDFKRSDSVSRLLIASEPENAKAWWNVLLGDEACASEEEFLEKCDCDTVAMTVRRPAFQNAYQYAQGEFREHLTELRQKICEKFEPKAQACRDKIADCETKIRNRKERYQSLDAAKDREIDAANAEISHVFAVNPILKTFREKPKKRFPMKGVIVSGILFIIAIFAAWIGLTFGMFTDMPEVLELEFITWAWPSQEPVIPLVVIQAAIYGVLGGVALSILLAIIVAIAYRASNDKNSRMSHQYNAAYSMLTRTTSKRDDLHSQKKALKSELEKALNAIDREQLLEQKKLDNYENFIAGNDNHLLEIDFAAYREAAYTADPAPAKKAKNKKKTASGTSFGVELLNCGNNKIAVIRIIRQYLHNSLDAAKKLAEKGGGIAQGFDEERAISFATQLREAGASVQTIEK